MTKRKTTKKKKPNNRRTSPSEAKAAFKAEDHPNTGGTQSTIPGTETPQDKEIEKTARELHKAKKNYAAWGKTADVLNERLVGLVEAKGLEHYWHAPVTVNIKAKDPKKKAEVTIGGGK